MVSRRVTLLGSILLLWLSTYLLVDSGLDADGIITAQLLVFLVFGLQLIHFRLKEMVGWEYEKPVWIL